MVYDNQKGADGISEEADYEEFEGERLLPIGVKPLGQRKKNGSDCAKNYTGYSHSHSHRIVTCDLVLGTAIAFGFGMSVGTLITLLLSR